MKPPTMNLPLVIIEWADAWFKEEGITLGDAKIPSIHSPTIVHTLGWVLFEDEGGVSLATEYYDDTYRGRTYIPRGMIVTTTPYKLTKKKAKNVKPAS